MNLTCPSCDSTFRVDPEAFGTAARRVRCGACGHEWRQERPAEDSAEPGAEEAAAEVFPVPPETAAPEPAAPPEAAERGPGPPSERPARIRPQRAGGQASGARRGSGRRIAAGWIAFLLVLGGVVAGAYFGRTEIVARVPAAADIYRLAGIQIEEPLGEGLELREVRSARRLIDGQKVVVIEGLVANVSDKAREVPQLRVSVTDGTGEQVDAWVFSARDGSLPPGGVTQFATTTRNAPSEGSLGIDFVASR